MVDNMYGKEHTATRLRCPMGWNSTVDRNGTSLGTMRMPACAEEHCEWWAGSDRGCCIKMIAKAFDLLVAVVNK